MVGTHGMKLLQQAVREASPNDVHLLHWSTFNPVEARRKAWRHL